MPQPATLPPAARLRRAFALAEELHTAFLVPVLPAAWPSVDASLNLLHAVTEPASGCRSGIVVLAFPELDPETAGPMANTMNSPAIRGAATAESVFNLASAYREDGGRVPLVALASSAVVDRLGPDRFAARCIDSGFAATLLPDLLTDLYGDGYAALTTPDLPPAAFTALVGGERGISADDRLLRLAHDAFLCAIRTAQREEEMALAEMASAAHSARTRLRGRVRLVVGGGVSTRGHVAALAPHTHGIVIGRCLATAMTEARAAGEPEDAAALELLADLASGIARHSAGNDRAIFEPETIA